MNYQMKKFVYFGAADIILIALAMGASFLLRFDGVIPDRYQGNIPFYILMSIAITLPLLYWRKLYAFTWSFVSLDEMVELAKTTAISAFGFFLIYLFFQRESLFLGFPRSIIIIHHTLVFIFLGGLRSAKRIGLLIAKTPSRGTKKSALIIGANERADELIRSLNKEKSDYALVGILDDDPEKHSTFLRGVKVLGSVGSLPQIAKIHDLQTLIIALPDADRKTIQKTISHARKENITDVKIIPSVYEALQGKLTLENLRAVQVEDLLGRRVAHIDTKEIARFLEGKHVLVTGAAGSIGSELCRQMSAFAPKALSLLDYEESNLFNLARELEADYPSLNVKPVVADVRNERKISSLMEERKPHIIFHAAAYKHVPLMEEFPEEAVMTNVLGTLHLSKAAHAHGVEKVVLISTDKAVRPVSIMGKTKRIAEMIVEAMNRESKTNFVSVRFGNVLGSRGSVLPIFQDQLKRKAPLTITDRRMARYFMTAPEACLLVLEAGAIGEGGEIFVLDMGKPVRIVELARDLIRLSGLRPDKDVPIVYTKPRPGEKFFEDIFSNEEGMVATRYQKIFRTKSDTRVTQKELFNQVEKLTTHLHDRSKLNKALANLIT